MNTVAPNAARASLHRQQTTTVADYAQQEGISTSTSRKRLNEMAEIGRAQVSYGVIIGSRTSKRGSRSSSVSVRGNLYYLNA